MPPTIKDRFGRPLRDLRVSVTDRCNFRCTYCMPKEVFGKDFQFLRRDEILTFEEIARLARVFVEHGVEKIRLTGGEPLVRKHLADLVAMLRPIDGLRVLTLTTTGSLLADQAQDLKAAGLDRVTVSLDSLDDAVFRRMNDVDFPVSRVLEGIDAAQRAGLGPIKINMVVQRGINEHTVVDFARYFKGSGHIVRFIEYMDVGNTNGWRMEDVVSGREIVDMIDREMPLVATDPNYRGEVAERWRYGDGEGEIGVITSVTQPFCQDCTRARLSAEGQLYTCLFATHGTDFRTPLRSGSSDTQISDLLHSVWGVRDDRYSEIRTSFTRPLQKIEMSRIGG
ncbi:MAG TPA: GTP 3',8-cyclase MoaA [Dehalococcoidia bacterium]|nr:GTP 3',8-cyclase MoaA [Dehalococcoidia bacterium]